MRFDEKFEEIYLKYSDKIYRFLYWRSFDGRLAEDITSETFLKAWKNWGKFKPDYVQAWLYKIANNLLIDYFRRQKNSDGQEKESSLEIMSDAGIEPFYDEDLIEKIQRDDNIKKLHQALDQLPKRLKEIAILRFIEELSAREVGEILGISEVNVRVLQHRALVKLKEILKNEQ